MPPSYEYLWVNNGQFSQRAELTLVIHYSGEDHPRYIKLVKGGYSREWWPGSYSLELYRELCKEQQSGIRMTRWWLETP